MTATTRYISAAISRLYGRILSHLADCSNCSITNCSMEQSLAQLETLIYYILMYLKYSIYTLIVPLFHQSTHPYTHVRTHVTRAHMCVCAATFRGTLEQPRLSFYLATTYIDPSLFQRKVPLEQSKLTRCLVTSCGKGP